MSRTLGDTFAKEFGVTAVPDILTGTLTSNDRAFVVASDGLWDVVKNQQVVEVISKFWEQGEVNSAAVALQSIAVKNAMKHGSYVDDISIVVVFRQ
jgi:protein phosphatase 1L